MVAYVIVLFFLSYMEETSDLSPAQREKHLAARRKTGCVASVASQKERNSSSKREEAQRISKINKWKESVPVLWWRDDVTVPKPSTLHSSEGAAAARCPCWGGPGHVAGSAKGPRYPSDLGESVSTRTHFLLFLIILCTLAEEEMQLLQELVFWVQKG